MKITVDFLIHPPQSLADLALLLGIGIVAVVRFLLARARWRLSLTLAARSR